MLVDFSDGIKLGGEPKPIMVDLSDEKKHPWMFTLDGLTLWTASLLSERWMLDVCWTAASFWTLDGGLILFYSERQYWTHLTMIKPWNQNQCWWTSETEAPWTAASFYSERWTIVHAGCSLWTASYLGRRPHSILNAFLSTQNCRKKQIIFKRKLKRQKALDDKRPKHSMKPPVNPGLKTKHEFEGTRNIATSLGQAASTGGLQSN